MIFSYDKIYDHNFQSQNVRSLLIVKQDRSLHSVPKWNNQSPERIYVTKK